ncbi:SgcJ/EcaC family oxidoreductase [Methylobacterium sp. J-088]|uniref:YybH family protein n=1 Tax=Methylobacterium sp. J-088 TaxID=2836664 RepID=UPI001FBBA79A|nr:SgcJ/EcaC family oxidoreductase [Methylobacterium sp. J-088]MCJ2063700.1 SgcJ/EcaC family oxidoreductase [Methylobacterium sp. J-088]
MKVRLTAACVLAVLALIPTQPSIAQTHTGSSTAPSSETSDEAAIRAALSSYNAALNGGQTAAVLPLYTPDGIFMAPYTSSFIGQDAVRRAYDAVFKELKFDVTFNISEVVQMAPTWAFVRTNSAGKTLHHSSGKTTSEANQELFIFQKGDDGRWRIARYSFSPTNPPSQ